jgi:luciferase-type oxidoreductase
MAGDATGHANAGYQRAFGTDDLTFGLGFPLTGSREQTPDVEREMELAAHAEELGFDALWARDVPLYWPRFGDAGQSFDVWPWLSHAAAHTDEVALGTASVVLPLRHPLHVAKAAASVDRLSGGRLLMGIATGDRDPEYPAFGVDPDQRGTRFREAVEVLRAVWTGEFPDLETDRVSLAGDLDLVPEPVADTVPLLPTGHARQELAWIAEHGDGWLFYHLPEGTLESYLADWRAAAGEKPYAMAVRTELAADPSAEPEHVHQGYRAGSEWFVEYFRELAGAGVDHVLVSAGGENPERGLTRFAETVLDRV